ncbi:GTP cyclohydrolase 1 type 2 [Sodalis praecaptivus]|uniref:type 2 GTP cyclohydrolase I n=1 Tax=Sodalis praecaptivus TaxID=1239307 RepID=UPI0027E97BF9|nr:type 2 GTP cyclohydrolase I [Sodalis praecaptivus]CAJ0998633.1 GTP cyclohydrolase 1 type 2 [Sodalis praecaptivus]
MRNTELEQLINQKLNSSALEDYAPNGLQVEGRQEVKRIVTGVTACQALLDSALAHGADTVMVHHGYFWKNESPVISGMKRRRLKTLLANDINLYAWHLPLDAHAELGNNAQLAVALDIRVTGSLEPLLPYGEFATPLSGEALRLRLEQTLGRSVLHCGDGGPTQIKRLAWCSGGGQGFIEMAAQAGMDAFITGEVSEQTIHIAREEGLHFYAAGHHATERGGIRALGEWLAQQYDFDVTFIDVPNPV